MIRVDIHEYCQKCLDFEADVERPVKMFSGEEVIQTDTVIRCEYRGRCEAIRRYLEKNMKEKEADAQVTQDR